MRGTWHRLARPIGRDTQRLLAAMVGVLFCTAGVGGLLITAFAADHLEHPVGVGIVATIALLVGVGLLALAQWTPDLFFEQFDRVALTLILLATLNVSAGQWAVGPGIIVELLLLAEISIFAFYLFPRRTAMASIGLMGVSLAIVMVVQGGYQAPAAQWGFCVVTLLAIGVVFGSLLKRGVDESTEINHLRRFLPPAVAEALLSSGDDAILAPHRRKIAVMFFDLRGFTRFSTGAEPEEVVEILDAYYATVGAALRDAGATIGTFAGDGIMAYFNDPIPIDDPAGTAVDVARALRAPLDALVEQWGHKGFDLGYGVGIAFGYATLGVIGLEGRYDYTALGSVTNLASRLCGEASHRDILVDHKTADATRDRVELLPCELTLKGFSAPVVAFRVDALDLAALDEPDPAPAFPRR